MTTLVEKHTGNGHSSTQCSDFIKKTQKVSEHLKPYTLSEEQMRKMKSIFAEEMQLGFAKNPSRKGSLLMMNTYITRDLDSHQSGSYLSLDLGSTNFRVCHLQFVPGERNDRFHVKYYDIPPSYRVGDAAPLFNHIAVCIKDFVTTEMEGHNPEIVLPLGFTFSFPMTQLSIDKALLNTWTKSYDIPQVVNRNPTEFLQNAIDAINLKVKIVALINDSTGTLVKGQYLNKDCTIGVIMGTGFNICYTENDVKRMEKWTEERLEKYADTEKVMIDIECGAFGDNGSIDFVKTDVDFEIDNRSLFPKSFSYEKLLAGKFLGSIAQLVLRDLIKKKLILNGHLSQEIQIHDNFPTSYVSHIEGSCSNEWIEKAFHQLGYTKFDELDVYALKQVCEILSNRSAQLVSVLLASIIDWINEENTVVAIDGSLYKHHPKIDRLMREHITLLTNGKKKFDLILAEDGSGKGAGLVASIAQHL